MRLVTLRCGVCKVKVLCEIPDANYETMQEALDLGIQEGKWELYWAVIEENRVRCFLHEQDA